MFPYLMETLGLDFDKLHFESTSLAQTSWDKAGSMLYLLSHLNKSIHHHEQGGLNSRLH